MTVLNAADDIRVGATGASKVMLNGVQVWPSGAYVLDTPVLIYTYAGAEGYVNPTKIAPSATGTLLLSYRVPQVVGGNPDRYGLIQELDTDGTLLDANVDTYAEPIYYLATDAAGHYYSIDDHGHERIYRDGDGSDWSNISSLSASYSDPTVGIAVNPDDGSVWFTANNGKVFSVDSSGGSLTSHTVTSSGAFLDGIVWVVDRFYMIGNGTGSYYEYLPGTGLISSDDSSPDSNHPRDIAYSPLTDRLYFSTDTPGTGTFISSNDRIGGTAVTEFDNSYFSGGRPSSITCVGSGLYVTCNEINTGVSPNTCEGTVWKIPIIPA